MLRQMLALGIALGLAIAAPAHAADDAVGEVVKLGFATALSGPFAATGQRDRNAFEAAIDDLNIRGGVLGHRVEGVVVDDACGIEEAVATARKLIQAGVVGVIGHMCSHSSLMAAGLYESADIPMLTPFSTHPLLTEEGRPNVFRLIGRDDDQGAFVADHVHQSWPERRLAIVHDGSTYGEGLAREMRTHLRWLGSEEILYQQYTPGAEAYPELVATLDEAGADLVFIGGYGPDAGRIVRAARGRGLEAQFLGGDGLDMEGFWATAGAAGEGTLFSDRPIDDFAEVPPDLIASLDEHGVSRHPSELGTYAAVQTWAEAVRRAGTFALRPVARELSLGRFDTLLGVLAFNARGDLRRASWEWRAWSDGRHAPIDPASPT